MNPPDGRAALPYNRDFSASTEHMTQVQVHGPTSWSNSAAVHLVASTLRCSCRQRMTRAEPCKVGGKGWKGGEGGRGEGREDWQ